MEGDDDVGGGGRATEMRKRRRTRQLTTPGATRWFWLRAFLQVRVRELRLETTDDRLPV